VIGRTVSHYLITRQLGAGGMGVVYEAEDTKLKRTVALKFLAPDSTRDPDAKARFVREAQAASALDHPNVCTIYEVDETDDGQLFLAMACYEGETLRERIARGPLPIEDAMDITRQVADGLAKTHEREIVHRDIKPANIFLTEDGLVKILDFGLAKLSNQTLLTRTGTTMGTVSYMSPEQARGETADHQSDLWSLGVILHEMVTGVLPFPGDHPQAVIYAILNQGPEPVTSLRAGVPLELEKIVGKCLAKSTDQRFQSAGELVAILPRLNSESGTGPMIMIPSVTYWGRHRRRFWITGAVAVCVALAIMTWQQFRGGPASISGQEKSIAVVGFRILQEEDHATGSAALTSLVNVGLVESSPVRVVSPSFLHDQRRRLFGKAHGPIAEGQALEVARASGASMFLLGDITNLRGEQIVTWQLVDTSSGGTVGAKRIVGGDLIDVADRVVAGVLLLVAEEAGMDEAPEAPSVASLTTRSSDSYRLYTAGVRALEDQRFDVALDSLEKAVAIDSTFAMAHLALSRLHQLRPGGIGDAGGVRRHADAAWEYRFRLGRKERMRVEVWQAQRQARLADVKDLFAQMRSEWPDDREIMSDRLDFLYYYWYYRDALLEVDGALVSFPGDVELLENQNVLLSVLGEHDQALRVARRVVALEPDVVGHYQQLCARWLAVGEPDSAETAARKALSIEPDYLLARIQLAQCQYVRGDLAGATKTMEMMAREAGLDPMDAVRVLTSSSFRPSLTMLFGEAGRHGAALAVFGQAEGMTRSAGTRLAIEGRRHRYLLRQGRYQETLAWSNQILFGMPSYSGWFNAQINRIGALALADSADAARLAAADLVAAADSIGGLSIFMARRGTIVLLLKTNQPKEALALIKEVRKDGLPTGGMFDIEIRDAEIEALLLDKRLDDAEHALYEQLRLYGGHAKAHLTLGRVLEEQGHSTGAAAHYRHFLDAWSRADPDLPQVAEAKERLGRL